MKSECSITLSSSLGWTAIYINILCVLIYNTLSSSLLLDDKSKQYNDVVYTFMMQIRLNIYLFLHYICTDYLLIFFQTKGANPRVPKVPTKIQG